MTTPGKRREAFGAYFFAVEIDGIQGAFFRSCSGLKHEADVFPLAEGGVNTHERKLIGQSKYPNLVLKQGFANIVFWEMRQGFAQNEKKPRARFSGTIVQYGPGQTKAHSWRFENAWVAKWEGPEFDASKNEISVETIEIAHEGLTYQSAGAPSPGGGR